MRTGTHGTLVLRRFVNVPAEAARLCERVAWSRHPRDDTTRFNDTAPPRRRARALVRTGRRSLQMPRPWCSRRRRAWRGAGARQGVASPAPDHEHSTRDLHAAARRPYTNTPLVRTGTVRNQPDALDNVCYYCGRLSDARVDTPHHAFVRSATATRQTPELAPGRGCLGRRRVSWSDAATFV